MNSIRRMMCNEFPEYKEKAQSFHAKKMKCLYIKHTGMFVFTIWNRAYTLKCLFFFNQINEMDA